MKFAWHGIWLGLLIAGTIANTAVRAVNGGMMPVPIHTNFDNAHCEAVAGTRLLWLADVHVFTWGRWDLHYSVGDVLLTSAIIAWIITVLVLIAQGRGVFSKLIVDGNRELSRD